MCPSTLGVWQGARLGAPTFARVTRESSTALVVQLKGASITVRLGFDPLLLRDIVQALTGDA
jgi:hypothetical protein